MNIFGCSNATSTTTYASSRSTLGSSRLLSTEAKLYVTVGSGGYRGEGGQREVGGVLEDDNR